MSKTLTPPIDLHAPGAVDALLAFHRSVFGDARMENDPAPAADPAPTGDPAPAPTPTGDPAPAPADPAPAAEKVEDLPEWAQKIIRDTRAEAADRRTKATAAEQERQQLLDGIATALGIKKDGADTPTPEQLAQQLADAQNTGKATSIELAVFKAAATAGADPNALTDSRTFMQKVTALDPTADDFAEKVTAAITEAVEKNPNLKVAQVAPRNGNEIPGGPGGQRKPPANLTEAISAHYGA